MRCMHTCTGVTSSREAWKRVKANRGAAGVDEETLADVEEYGVERMLEEVRRR
jgi:RNA-directed DNA polymerase